MIRALIILMLLVTVRGGEPELDYMNEIPAHQILVKIEKSEPINLSHIIVIGDLDLSKLNYSTIRVIDSPIRIIDSSIHGDLNFNNTILLKPVSFEKTKFFGPAYFFQSRFEREVNFAESQFNNTAIFGRSTFNGSVNFKNSHFLGMAYFWKSRIGAGQVDFEGVHFEGPAYFMGTQFSAESVNFAWSQFDGPASFWDTQFNGLANFKGSQFSESVDLTIAQFNKPADFLGSRFDRELYFNDVKFSSLKVNWESLKDKLICNGPMYIALIKNFKELEQFEDADDCYYQYRNWKRNNRQFGWPKFFDFLAWISCGYGVRWQHTIFSGVFVIVLFGIYFELTRIIGTDTNLLQKKSIGLNMHDLAGSLKRSLSFSAMILLSLPSEWYPFGKEKYEKILKFHLHSAIFERLIGWSLMLLLISTLTRLMVRY